MQTIYSKRYSFCYAAKECFFFLPPTWELSKSDNFASSIRHQFCIRWTYISLLSLPRSLHFSTSMLVLSVRCRTQFGGKSSRFASNFLWSSVPVFSFFPFAKTELDTLMLLALRSFSPLLTAELKTLFLFTDELRTCKGQLVFIAFVLILSVKSKSAYKHLNVWRFVFCNEVPYLFD